MPECFSRYFQHPGVSGRTGFHKRCKMGVVVVVAVRDGLVFTARIYCVKVGMDSAGLQHGHVHPQGIVEGNETWIVAGNAEGRCNDAQHGRAAGKPPGLADGAKSPIGIALQRPPQVEKKSTVHRVEGACARGAATLSRRKAHSSGSEATSRNGRGRAACACSPDVVRARPSGAISERPSMSTR